MCPNYGHLLLDIHIYIVNCAMVFKKWLELVWNKSFNIFNWVKNRLVLEKNNLFISLIAIKCIKWLWYCKLTDDMCTTSFVHFSCVYCKTKLWQ